MAPVRKTVASAVTAIALIAVTAGCQLGPGGLTAPPAPPTTAPPTTAPPTTAPPTTAPPTTAPPANSGLGAEAAEVVRLTNEERVTAGCGALGVDSRLSAAAQGHSEDMAANNYFSHTGLDGGSPGDRVRAAGFPTRYVGENIAAGSTTAAATVEMWMNSSGHRANILNCEYNVIGVGYATGGSYRHYWTQNFGRL